MEPNRTALSKNAQKVLAALQSCGAGWHSRAEIAAQMGKRRLNPYEVAALETLVEAGSVEAERHEVNAPIPQRWEYRVKG